MKQRVAKKILRKERIVRGAYRRSTIAIAKRKAASSVTRMWGRWTSNNPQTMASLKRLIELMDREV